MELAFWFSLFIIFYTFLGYGILLYFIVRIKRLWKTQNHNHTVIGLPKCTLVVAAYNEEVFIEDKIMNSFELDYPTDKLDFIFATDGSDDKTTQIIAKFPRILLLNKAERLGKVAAIHRAMKHVESPITVFSDANTTLNRDALKNICRHFDDPAVGAVAGEKRILVNGDADAGAAGEGFYWRYESALKKWDSELYSVVGAAGELFAIRTALWETIENDTILDDFMISMLIAKKGYRIIYDPGAFAIETGSENIGEELKRKIRIAAGGIQAIIRLRSLLNLFNFGLLSFQYISHRVLRWTICPFLLPLLFILNIGLTQLSDHPVYKLLLIGQFLFYGLALLGFLFENMRLRIKFLFIPYYFCIMNYAVIMGIVRYFSGRQSAVWEKSRRKAAV